MNALVLAKNADDPSLAASILYRLANPPPHARELVLVTRVITDLRNRPDIAKLHAHRQTSLRLAADELWHRHK